MNTDNKKKVIIQILAVIGFILTIKLAMIYYVANYEKYALASFCSINDVIDCDGAARTKVSQFLGIPLAYWGMLFYLIIFFLTVVDKLKNCRFLKFLEVFKNPMAYITVIGTFAFACSMLLAGFSAFVIKKVCILCVITYLIDFLIALVPANSVLSFKTTVFDFIDGIKNYPKTFVVLLIMSIGFLTFSGITNTFVPHIKKSKEIRKYALMKENPYKINGNTLGAENADVVIELYSDFVCPLCYIHNIMLHKAAQEYSNIKIIHHNIPFDKECNVMLSFNMHPGACYMAKAALAAEKQGNYWGMSTLLYENHPKNDEALAPLVEKLGLDKDKFFKDLYSKEIENKLDTEINRINDELGLDSTPTMYINGEQKIGIMPYGELKKYLESYGAKKR